MAGASDTPHMGIDTFCFQNLINRISGGPLWHLKQFASHRETVVSKNLCDRPPDLPEQGESWFSDVDIVGDTKSN